MQYSLQDFLQAQIEAHVYGHAHPDLQTYSAQKAQAFRGAFQMSLDTSDQNAAQRSLASIFSPLFTSALDSYIAIQTPFAGYLEVSRRWRPLIEQYDSEFAQQVAQMQELHRRFMLTILEKWYGPLTASVSSTDLLQYGFDDNMTAPDLDDYI